MENYPKIFSFFSGTGCLDLGFEKTGYKIVYVNEIHKPFLKCYIYARNCMNIPEPIFKYHEGDISELTEGSGKAQLEEIIRLTRKMTKLVGFIGGPPCPDFSIGGKNRGKEGDNGKLSATYIKLICQQKPDFFLFENVKGLWRTKKHRAFYEELKKKLHKAGYITTERLINAIEYGAPQDRERIILIGFSKNLVNSLKIDTNHNHTLPENVFPWNHYIKYPKDTVFNCQWPTKDPFVENSELPYPEGIIRELTVEYWFKKNNVYNHPNMQQYFKPKAGITKIACIDEGDGSKKSYKRLHRWRFSPTACYGNNEVHLHPYKIRRISVAEVLSIQSLPKEFVLPLDLTLTNAFKTLGNGVPYLAAKGIANTILDFLGVIK